VVLMAVAGGHSTYSGTPGVDNNVGQLIGQVMRYTMNRMERMAECNDCGRGYSVKERGSRWPEKRAHRESQGTNDRGDLREPQSELEPRTRSISKHDSSKRQTRNENRQRLQAELDTERKKFSVAALRRRPIQGILHPSRRSEGDGKSVSRSGSKDRYPDTNAPILILRILAASCDDSGTCLGRFSIRHNTAQRYDAGGQTHPQWKVFGSFLNTKVGWRGASWGAHLASCVID